MLLKWVCTTVLAGLRHDWAFETKPEPELEQLGACSLFCTDNDKRIVDRAVEIVATPTRTELAGMGRFWERASPPGCQQRNSGKPHRTSSNIRPLDAVLMSKVLGSV
jgi:hypothetical protein